MRNTLKFGRDASVKNMIWNFLVMLTVIVFSASAHAEKWVIVTNEWPPFTCSRCPENGAAVKALRELLKTQGIELEVIFTSWTQALKMGGDKDKVGFFPIWSESVKEGYMASDTLFKSPLGFVEPRGKPLVWNRLSDLKGKTIGIAKDYGYTEEFSKLIKEGVIKSEVVDSDDTNLRKVALGKIDGAILDLNNAKYFLAGSLKILSHEVAISSKIIESKTLHIGFNPHSHAKNEVIKAGLKKVQFQKIVDNYLAKYMASNFDINCDHCFSSVSPVLAQYP